MTKRVLLFFPFLLSLTVCFAQLNRADSYFDHYEYFKAIPLYRKIVEKDSSIKALQRLADCYRLLKDYKNAEVIYEKVIQRNGVDPINFFFYGLALKNNSKIQEAKVVFRKYSNLVPDDKKSIVSLKSCDDIKIWMTRPLRFEVKNERYLNSPAAEFCPVYYKNEIVFTTERLKDLVNFESNKMNNQPFLKVYYTIPTLLNGTTVFSKPRVFPGPVNSDYHDGPVSFDANNTIYSTRVCNFSKGADFVNRPKILIFTEKKSNKNGKNWDKPKEFPYNSDTYNVEHPFITPDGEILYFTSNMPGGYGGNDIWLSRKKDGMWGKPENLGPEINTTGNESFPYLRKDGLLYFSSDGQPGFGGLDIFSASFGDGKWGNVENLGFPLNSPTDDFGIVFSEDLKGGYFSSDRPGGLGSDDIYSFIVANKAIDISGKVLLSRNSNDPARNVKLILMTEDGTIINFSTSDSMGFFKFKNLSPDLKYLVKMDENDLVLKNRKKLYLADTANKIVRITVTNDKGDRFVFQNLPADHNDLALLDENDNGTPALEGRILFGVNNRPLVNARISLINEKGELQKTTITNSIGTFVFTEIAADQKYLIKLEENDYILPPGTKIIVLNKAGEVIFSAITDEKGFRFQLLPADHTKLKLSSDEDVKLKLSMSGRLLSGIGSNKPLADVKVNLLNEKGEFVQTVYTDSEGDFKFTNLPADQNFLVKADDSDPKLAQLSRILLSDEKGKIIGELIHGTSGTFQYKYLSSDQSSLSLMGVDDSQLRFRMKGQITNGDGSNKGLANTKVNLLNDRGEIIQSVLTNASGNFVFVKLPPGRNYFITVDEQSPGLAAIKRLFLKDEGGNIVRDIRLDNKGGFRFRLIAMDVKVLALMEVENSDLKNDLLGRLIESDGSKKAIANRRINLINENGEVVDSAVTDINGEFVFKNLPVDRKYLVKLSEADLGLYEKFKLVLKDKNGQDMVEMGSSKDGIFQYELLASDKQLFSKSEENDGKVHLNLKGCFLAGDSNRTVALYNSRVNLYDLRNHLLGSTLTDKHGRFSFFGLPPDQRFIIKMDDQDSNLRLVSRLILTDQHGVTIKELRTNRNIFRFELLSSDVKALSEEVVDESDLKLKLPEKKATDAAFNLPPGSGPFENIYFGLGSYALSPEAINVLKKIAKFINETPHAIIEIDGHADCRGEDRGNLFLSDHRVREVKNYLVFRGVNVNRLKGIAFGERRPVNDCINHVDCTEEQYAQNRRVEFKVLMYYFQQPGQK